MKLTTTDHDRGAAGLTYVYPVVSRRAGGLSVGINLNPNNACNFRCAYCQVEGLVRGNAPPIDLELLERELSGFLDEVLQGDFLSRHVPEDLAVLRDVAFSGNGEPTSAQEFDRVVELVSRVITRAKSAAEHADPVPLVLITNGSLMQKPAVQKGLEALARHGGEVWFKLDRATDEGLAAVNDFHGGLERLRTNLAQASRLAPTWIQTMLFRRAGKAPDERECSAYRELLDWARAEQLPLLGILLYGLARPSFQPEAPELEALSPGELEACAKRLAAAGFPVRCHV